MLSIALIVAFFFAANIGASGTAASMGAAYGGGAIRIKWVALLLAAVSVFAGAYLGGGEVVKTISGGIIPSDLLNVKITIGILASACLTLFIANLLGIPLSTSEVTVGAVVGVGIAYQSINIGEVLFIACVWIVMPFLSYVISYGLGRLISPIEQRVTRSKFGKWFFTLLLIGAGCYEAFSAGMNNVANAVGPLVGAKLIDTSSAIFWGGLFVALGAFLLGGRVLETNATKITQLSLMKSSAVSLTSGTLVIIASLFGIPVPLTQATTMSIFGIGTANHGSSFWRSPIVKRVIKVWILSPVISLAVSFAVVETFILHKISGPITIACIGLLAGAMALHRLKTKRALVSNESAGN
ncbi:inorganic phosphate transporter [Paenibacillus pinistramenti]|uniref:inorganic phosphate transporter n=1 Tax=Paenibacillus pinistramenti TaxID=1768003 RepID=UPI00193A1D63